jgi:hypothetical protein
MSPLLQYILVDIGAILLGSYVTAQLFGGSYFDNVKGNFLVMALGEAAHYALKERTQLADYFNL